MLENSYDAKGYKFGIVVSNDLSMYGKELSSNDRKLQVET